MLTNPADGDAEHIEQGPHPLGITFGEVVVHREQMDPSSREREARPSESADESLPLAGIHLDGMPSHKRGARRQLLIEGLLPERPLRRCPQHRQQVGRRLGDGARHGRRA